MAEKTYKPLLIDSVTALADLKQHRFVGLDGNVCQAGAKAYGVCDVDTDAEQYTPVAVSGILLVTPHTISNDTFFITIAFLTFISMLLSELLPFFLQK